MNRGYIKLWRKSQESEVFEAGPELWYLWTYILTQVCGKPHRFVIRKSGLQNQILLDSGQMFFSDSSLSKKLKMKTPTLKKRLGKLVQMGMITRRTVYVEKKAKYPGAVSWGTGALGSVLTVCNWWRYQSTKDAEKNDTVSRGGIYNKEELLKNVNTISYIDRSSSNMVLVDDGRLFNTETGMYFPCAAGDDEN